tara:strand:+ start:53 stop:1009 length:957 start_codon:yes stop_codon:yes gene_type:complete
MAYSGQFPNNILDHVLISKDNIIDKSNLNNYSDTDSDSEENLIRMKKNKNENKVWNEKEDNIILEERDKRIYGHTERVFKRFAKESCSENKKSIRQIRLRSIFLNNQNPIRENILNTSESHSSSDTPIRSNKNWTPEEDAIIIREHENDPNNYTAAAMEYLPDRTRESIKTRWKNIHLNKSSGNAGSALKSGPKIRSQMKVSYNLQTDIPQPPIIEMPASVEQDDEIVEMESSSDRYEFESTHYSDPVDKKDKNTSIESNHQSNYDDDDGNDINQNDEKKDNIKKRKLIDRFNDLEDCKEFMTTEEYNDKRESLIGLI